MQRSKTRGERSENDRGLEVNPPTHPAELECAEPEGAELTGTAQSVIRLTPPTGELELKGAGREGYQFAKQTTMQRTKGKDEHRREHRYRSSGGHFDPSPKTEGRGEEREQEGKKVEVGKVEGEMRRGRFDHIEFSVRSALPKRIGFRRTSRIDPTWHGRFQIPREAVQTKEERRNQTGLSSELK